MKKIQNNTSTKRKTTNIEEYRDKEKNKDN